MTLSSLLCKPKITVEVRHTVLYCDVVVVMASSLYSEDAVLLSLSLSLSLAHTHTHTHTQASWSWIILTSAYRAQGLVLLYQERLGQTKPKPVLNLSAVCSRGPSTPCRFPAYCFFISSRKQAMQRTEAPRHIYLNNFSKTAIRKTIYPSYSTYEWNVCTKKYVVCHLKHNTRWSLELYRSVRRLNWASCTYLQSFNMNALSSPQVKKKFFCRRTHWLTIDGFQYHEIC